MSDELADTFVKVLAQTAHAVKGWEYWMNKANEAADRIAALEAQVLEEKEANRWAYVQAALDDKAPPIPTPEPAPALGAECGHPFCGDKCGTDPGPTPAQLLADALELPEVKALVEAADAVADAEEGYLDAVIRGDLLDALAAIAKLKCIATQTKGGA